MSYLHDTAAAMAEALADGSTTSVALTQLHLDRIAAVDTDVHAFLHVDAEGTEALPLVLGDVGGSVRKIADVADARLDGVAVAEVARDRPRLRGRLHDDEALRHGGTP